MASRNQRRGNKNQSPQKPSNNTQSRRADPVENPNLEQQSTRDVFETRRNNSTEQESRHDRLGSGNEKAFWKKPSLTDWIMMVATAVIAIATAWNAIYVGGQLYEMKVDQRPFVSLNGTIEAPQIIQNKNQQWQVLWNWQFINFGRGVAYRITMHCFVKVGASKFEDACGPGGIFTQEFPPGISRLATAILPPGIDNNEFARLLTIDGAFQMRIDIQYFSEIGDMYQSSICLSRLSNGLFMFPNTNKCKD